MLSLIGFIASSCVKENTKEDIKEIIPQKDVPTATGQRITMEKTSGGSSDILEADYVLSASVGHNSTDCNNSCTMVGGVTCHVNCQGWGSICNSTATVNVKKAAGKSHSYQATTLNNYGPTDGLTYNMPARSFYIAYAGFTNGYIWLNVPAQILQRNNINQYFHYSNISFTSQALYSNL